MPKTQLTDFIKVYENVLAPAQCEALIARFESSPHQHDKLQMEDAYSFTQVDVGKHWPDADAQIGKIFGACMHQYRQSLGLDPFWPHNPSTEGIRLKRYLPDGRDSFPPHVDVMDRSTAPRMMTAIIYLNVPGGGETIFPDLNVAVTPAPGRMVMFPPLWLFVHAGRPPKDRAKYTLQSYLWYPHAPGTEP